MGYKLKRATIWRDNSRLPSEYQEVEYIQSSGTQYFIVGSSFKTSYKSVIDFQMTAIGGDYVPLGCNDSNPSFYRYGIDAFDSSFKIISGGRSRTSTISEDTNRHTITIDKNSATVDGINYNVSYTNATITRGIGVFCYNQQTDGVGYESSAKLYKLDIYDENETHIYDLVPCYRKSDTEVGMYDLINDVFYTNEGTGTFTKGNDVGGLVEKQVRPTTSPGWHPGANTLAYFPLKTDQLDVAGNYTLSATGTQQTVGYQFNTACSFSYETAVAEKYFSYWVNVSSSTRCALGINNYGKMRLNWRNNATNYERFVFASNNVFYESSNLNLSYDTWYNIAYSIDGSGNYNCYVNGTSVYSGTKTLSSYTVSNIINNTTGNIILSDIIIESEPRTAQEVSDYYDLTKANYGIS